MEGDLCIVGAGAAGLAIARALRGSGLSVVLLEGGGFEATRRSQELYDARMETVYGDEGPDYPTSSRLRFFGGTTNHWRGWCLPLEPDDLAARDWIPHSGWPLTWEELARWYAPAAELAEIPPFEPDHGASRRGSRAPALAGSERLATRIFHFSSPTRFGERYRDDVLADRDTRVLVEANVLELLTDRDATRIAGARVHAEEGPRFEVRARGFVLATGGIENARLLLLSDAHAPGGLGNAHDLVGRFFMDHPHLGHEARVVLRDPQARDDFLRLYLERERDPAVDGRTLGVFVLDAETRRRERLQAWSVSLRPLDPSDLDALGRSVADTAAAVDAWGHGTPAERGRSLPVRLSVRGEQAPSPESRVTLTRERDRLGLRRAALDWRVSRRDADSIRRSLEIFCHEVAAAGLGRGRILLDPEDPWRDMSGGNHHMGTTRMAEDPRRGVVGADGRVHGVANLWIAGSSVFPTCGFANPTLTLLALSLRLADHLRGALRR